MLHYGLTENTNLPESTNEAYWWKIVAINLIKQGVFEKNDWKEWSNIPDKSLIINRLSDKTLPLSVRVSIPDWLEEEGIQQFGKEWENEIVEKRLKKLNLTKKNHRDYQRFILSAATKLTLDNQGRVSLPASLIEHAGIEKSSVVTGSNDHIEIWSEEKWKEYITEKSGIIEDIVDEIEF